MSWLVRPIRSNGRSSSRASGASHPGRRRDQDHKLKHLKTPRQDDLADGVGARLGSINSGPGVRGRRELAIEVRDAAVVDRLHTSPTRLGAFPSPDLSGRGIAGGSRRCRGRRGAARHRYQRTDANRDGFKYRSNRPCSSLEASCCSGIIAHHGAALVGQAPIAPAAVGCRRRRVHRSPPRGHSPRRIARRRGMARHIRHSRWSGSGRPATTPPRPCGLCRITHDADNLYVGCRPFDPRPRNPGPLLSRDDIDRSSWDDHVNIIIDPFNRSAACLPVRVSARAARRMRCSARPRGSRTGRGMRFGLAGRIDGPRLHSRGRDPLQVAPVSRTAGVQTGFILERSYPRSVRHRIQSAPRDRTTRCLLCEANKVTGFRGSRRDGTSSSTRPSRQPTDLRAQCPTSLARAPSIPRSAWTSDGASAPTDAQCHGNPDFSQVEADVASSP